jgi:hypothetical protein
VRRAIRFDLCNAFLSAIAGFIASCSAQEDPCNTLKHAVSIEQYHAAYCSNFGDAEECAQHWFELDSNRFWREQRRAARTLLQGPSVALPSIDGRAVSVFIDPELTRWGRSREDLFARVGQVLSELGATGQLVDTPCRDGYCLNLTHGQFADGSIPIPANTISRKLALTNISAPEGRVVVPVSLSTGAYAIVGAKTNVVFCALESLGGHPAVDDLTLARCIYGGFAYPCSVGCQFYSSSSPDGELLAARREGRSLCPAA